MENEGKPEEKLVDSKEKLVEVIDQEVASQNKNLSVGKTIEDLHNKTNYTVKELLFEGIVLEHKPFFKNEKKGDLQIGYDEFIMAFEKKRFLIDGFTEEDAPELKRAVRDVIRDIEHKEELRLRTISERQITKRAEELEEEKQRILAKRKSRKIVREQRKEIEAKNWAIETLRREQEEEKKRQEEEIAKENARLEQIRLEEIELAKQRKILNAKVNAQKQRIRFSSRKS